MPFLASKVDLTLATATLVFTQVDVNASVANSPDEVLLEVHLDAGRKLSLRSADGAAELEVKALSGSANVQSVQQVAVPLASSRYFEYKLDGECPNLKVFLVKHNGTV